MKPRTAFILPDQHYAPPGDKAGGVDPAAESVALQAIRIVKPDIFINLGDVIEGDSVSHFRYKKVKRPPLEYMITALLPELKAGNEGMDRFDRELDKVGCNERHLTWGNHDYNWMMDFIAMHPYLEDKYHPDIAFKLKERGYESYEYGKLLTIGNCNFYHGGLYTGINVERDHALRLGANVVIGHHHHIGMNAVSHINGPHACWCLGCICKLEKPFLQNRKTAWQHGFGICHFNSDGTFLMEVVHIFRGQAIVYGKRVVAKT